MVGYIKLGFFVNGIGWHKETSELLYTIDSSTDSRYFKEGQVLEIDYAFFKIQSIELQFIDLPWEGHSEKPNRQKPIRNIYVSKAKIGMMGDKRKKEIVAINSIPKIKDLPEFDISQIVDDTEYSQENFKDDFGYLEKPIKKTKGKKKTKEEKILALSDIAALKNLKKRKKVAAPEKEKKPTKNLRRKVRTTDVMDMFGGNDTEKPENAPQSTKKAMDKQTPKKTRKKRCKGCDELFDDLSKHKCKGK